MSNYLSRPIETAPIVSNYNFDLINQVLATKQGRYDQNRAMIQQGLSYIDNLKVYGEYNEEYLNSKLNEMYATLEMGEKDLSSGVVADSYYSAINSVAHDPTIVNAVGSARVIDNFYANIQKMQSDPKTAGQVNQDNIEYALEKSGVNEYLASGGIGSVKSINYINYNDNQKELFETLKTIKDLRGEETVEIRGTGDNGIPVGEVQVKKIKGMTPREMVETIPGLLTPQQRQQMVINGWALSKRNPEGVQKQYDAIYDGQIIAYKNEIEVQNSIINNSTKSNEEKEEAQRRLKRLQTELEQVEATGKDIDLESKGFYLEQQGFINTLATSAGARISTTYEKDDIYFARQNLDIELEKLNLQKQKANQEATPFGDLSLSTSTFQGDYAQTLDIYANLENAYKTANNNITELISGVANRQGIDQGVLSEYEAKMKSMGYDKTGKVINQSLAKDISREQAMYRAYRDSGLAKLAGETSADIEVAKSLADNAALDYDRFLLEGVEETFRENPTKYLTSLSKSLDTFGGDEVQKRQVATQLASLLNEINGTNLTVSDVLVERNPLRAFSVMGRPVEVFGGSDFKTSSTLSPTNLNEAFKKATHKQIKKLADILDVTLGDRSLMKSIAEYGLLDRPFDSDNLREEAKAKTREKALSQGTQVASYGTTNLITISGQKSVQTILDMIPNIGAGEQVFDPKRSITVNKKPSGEIEVRQNMPISGLTGGKTKQDPIASYTFSVKDDGYSVISSLIDQSELDRGLDASKVRNTITHSTSPKFLGSANEDLVNKTTTYFMANVPTDLSKELKVNLANYLTESRTKKVYEEGLKRVLPPEQVNQTVNFLVSQIPNFKASFVPVDGQWSLEIKTNNGKLLHRGQVTRSGYLDKSLLNVITNYPETLVADKLLEMYMKNPEEVNKLFR